jgi:hypothetical protein
MPENVRKCHKMPAKILRPKNTLPGTACARSLHKGTTSAESQKLECFEATTNNFFKYYKNSVNPLFTTLTKQLFSTLHREHRIHIERANVHCQGTACTRSLHMSLTSAEGQKLQCFLAISIKIKNTLPGTACTRSLRTGLTSAEG